VVSPSERRDATSFLVESFEVSQRRACRLVGHARSTHRYEHRREEIPRLRERLVALAEQRPRFGYPRLHILLRREGFMVNRKRVYRLYRAAGLKLRAKRRKRAAPREKRPMTPATGANQSWSMDFVSDRLGDGRQFRTFTVVDDFVKRCPVLEVDTSISGQRVTRALDRAIESYGKPRRLIMDNGPEFTSRVLLEWAGRRDIELAWIEPGKPIQNAYVESFNARFRDECLNQHHFTTLADARALIEDWRDDYNHVRPHTSRGGQTPERFNELWSAAMAADQRLIRQPQLPFPTEINCTREPT
jgi:putative transposase